MAHDISDALKKPTTKIPCLGCGNRDGLIAPITDKKAVLWCMRCGTLVDTESTPMDALVPQLCVQTLTALGYQDPTSEAQKPTSQPAEESSEAPPKKE